MSMCGVDRCSNEAELEVILHGFYPGDSTVFLEQVRTCPSICAPDARRDETGIDGGRRPRSEASHPVTNKQRAQGSTIDRPL